MRNSALLVLLKVVRGFWHFSKRSTLLFGITAPDGGQGALCKTVSAANGNSSTNGIEFNVLLMLIMPVVPLAVRFSAITNLEVWHGLRQPGTRPKSLPLGFRANNPVSISATLSSKFYHIVKR